MKSAPLGQLILTGVPGYELDSETAALFRRVQPGGFILFGRNIQSAVQLRKLIDDLRDVSEVEPIITDLCKGVIEAAHRGGMEGVRERAAYCAFADRGVSLLQFNLFVESMARAGLVVRFGQDTLRATLKGLAYAGIDTRAPVNGSRGFAS